MRARYRLTLYHQLPRLTQFGDHTFGDHLDQRFLITVRRVGRRFGAHGRRRLEGTRSNTAFLPTAAEDIVPADVTVFVLGVFRGSS